MTSPIVHPRDPLHGITLETIINQLVQRYGWLEMGRRIPIRCFQLNPSLKSSLVFLRKTPWARKKVEDWFISDRMREEHAAEPHELPHRKVIDRNPFHEPSRGRNEESKTSPRPSPSLRKERETEVTGGSGGQSENESSGKPPSVTPERKSSPDCDSTRAE